MKRASAPMLLHLRTVALSRHLPLPEGFPFSVPIIRALESRDFLANREAYLRRLLEGDKCPPIITLRSIPNA